MVAMTKIVQDCHWITYTFLHERIVALAKKHRKQIAFLLNHKSAQACSRAIVAVHGDGADAGSTEP
jgi:hypothetical protein